MKFQTKKKKDREAWDREKKKKRDRKFLEQVQNNLLITICKAWDTESKHEIYGTV